MENTVPLRVYQPNEQDHVVYFDTQYAVAAFIRSRHTKQCRPDTVSWYYGILNKFSRIYPLLPQTPEEIEEFLLSIPTDEWRHGHFRTLKTFYRFLVKRSRGKVVNPVELIDEPRRRKKLPKYLSVEQLHHLLNQDHPHQIKEMMIFLADTGCRIREGVALSPEDLHETPDGHFAYVDGKTGPRYVPLSPITYTMLQQTLPFRYHRDTYSHRISDAFRIARLTGSAKTLRHTFATLWEGSDEDLRQILGHSDYKMIKVYRHLRLQNLSKQHRQYTPIRGLQQMRFDFSE